MSIKVIHQRYIFPIIRSAVNKAVDLIKPTYGPAANKVIISKVLNKLVVDDGVQIARDLELADESENAVLNVIRETAIRTNDRVGDGTTGSLIILQAIIEEVARQSKIDGHKIEKELRLGLASVKEQLKKMARPVKTKEDLLKVARIAFDSPEIAEIIADTWYKLGKDGIVTVAKSSTMETYAEVTEGITLDRGFVSPYMITNPNRMEAVVERPHILLTDYRLTETGDILPLMNKLVEKEIRNLVVICDNIENSALATMILNKINGQFNLVAINIPSGGAKNEVLEDIGLMIGAKVFSEKKGDKVDLAEIKDLGRADRFVAHRSESVIIGPKGNRTNLNEAIKELKTALLMNPAPIEKKQYEARLAKFTNKVAVIKVGAATENEERALRYKVEDSVNAVQAAFRGGIVSGGGLALANLVTPSPILNAALQVPFKQLKENIGLDTHPKLKAGEAINVVTGEIGKFMDVGVVDPVDVLIAAVESSVSIAGLLLTTSGMIVEPPQKPKQE